MLPMAIAIADAIIRQVLAMTTSAAEIIARIVLSTMYQVVKKTVRVKSFTNYKS